MPWMQIIGRVGRLRILNGSGVNARERTDAEIRYMQVCLCALAGRCLNAISDKGSCDQRPQDLSTPLSTDCRILQHCSCACGCASLALCYSEHKAPGEGGAR